MSKYREQLEAWLGTINIKADRVLDIGGSANTVKDRVKSWEVNEYKILDSGSEEKWHDMWIKPDYIWDINRSFRYSERIQSLVGFDIVFMLEVAEYLYDPYTALRNIYHFLNDNGLLYISFPTLYPLHNPKESDYLRYTKYGIMELLIRAGFNIIDLTARSTTLGLNGLAEFYSQEGLKPVKHDKAIFDVGYLVKAEKIA